MPGGAAAAIGSIAAALIGAAATAGTTAANLGNSKEARKENFEYGEKAASRAAVRQREYADYLQKLQYRQYYDLESPKAIIQQLKDAGLSPSIFAGGAMGGGISGVAQGNAPQGTGAVGPNAIPINPVGFTDLASSIESMSRAKLNDEEAKRLKGENAMGEAEISQILAEAGYKEAATRAQDTMNSLGKIDLAIKNETYSEAIRTIKANAEKAEWDSEDAFWAVANKEQKFIFDAATFKDRAESIKADVANTLADTALKYAQKNLAEEEKAKIIAQCEEIYNNLFYFKELQLDNAKAYQEWLNAQSANLPERLELLGKQLDIEKTKMWVDASMSVLHTAGNIVGLATLAKGKGGSTPNMWKSSQFDLNPNVENFNKTHPQLRVLK